MNLIEQHISICLLINKFYFDDKLKSENIYIWIINQSPIIFLKLLKIFL